MSNYQQDYEDDEHEVLDIISGYWQKYSFVIYSTQFTKVNT
jgi:hypothetical protein